MKQNDEVFVVNRSDIEKEMMLLVAAAELRGRIAGLREAATIILAIPNACEFNGVQYSVDMNPMAQEFTAHADELEADKP